MATGGKITVSSGGWLASTVATSAIVSASTDLWMKLRFKVDLLRGLGTSTQAALCSVGALTSVSADKWDVGFVGATGSQFNCKAVMGGNNVILTLGNTALTTLPASGTYVVAFIWYSTTLGTCGIKLFDDSGTLYMTLSGSATIAMTTGSGDGLVSIFDCGIVGFDGNAGGVAQGVAIYTSTPPTSGSTMWGAPTQGETGQVYLSWMNDAIGASAAVAQVGGSNLANNGTCTYSGPNQTDGLWGPPAAQSVTGVLAGMGSLAATDTETIAGTSALASMGSIAGTLQPVISCTVGLASMGSLGGTSVETLPATAAEASSGSLAAAATQTTGVTVATAGGGTVAAIAVETFVAAALEAGAGTLSAAILQSVGVQGNLFGAGLIAAIAQELLDAPASLAGGASLSAFGTVANPIACVVTLFGGSSLAGAIAIQLPTTASTYLLTQAIRNQLLNYVRWDGASLAAMLQNPSVATAQPSLYEVQAPDGGPYPYGVFRLVGRRRRSDVRWLMDCQVELDFYMRPRAQTKVVQDLGDVAEEALYAWKDPTSGIYIHSINRELMNFQSAPADRDVVREHLVANAMVPLLYLTAGQDVIP